MFDEARWETRKTILGPLLVNLLSAFLLFLSVVLFKKPIVALLGLQEADEFPISAVLESYQGSDGRLNADLFIFNRTGQHYSAAQLESLLILREQRDLWEGPHVKVELTAPSARILGLREDAAFNKGKAEYGTRQDKDTCHVVIKEIQAKAILKFVIETDSSRPASRDDKGGVPFYVFVAGSKVQ